MVFRHFINNCKLEFFSIFIAFQPFMQKNMHFAWQIFFSVLVIINMKVINKIIWVENKVEII